MRSPLLSDDACDEGGDEEDEEDGGEDHDDADRGALVDVWAVGAGPLDRGGHDVCLVSREIVWVSEDVVSWPPLRVPLRVGEPVTDPGQRAPDLHLGGHQPLTEGVRVRPRVLDHSLDHRHRLSCLLKRKIK